MSTEARLEMLGTYLAACERRDIVSITACFEESARVVDPLGEQKGTDAIRQYFEGIYKELAALSFETGPVCWCGQSCAVSWKGRGRRHDGSSVAYEGSGRIHLRVRPSHSGALGFWAPQDLLGSDSSRISRSPNSTRRDFRFSALQ
jgi:hypothetical protein